MELNIPSYPEKEYIIDDNLALIRNPQNLGQTVRFKEGEDRPLGALANERKRIPLNTRVKITDVKWDDTTRNVFVHAEPIDAPEFTPGGWTRASNLLDKFANEVVSFMPLEWDLEPRGDNFTVTDRDARIRKPGPEFEWTGERIPIGSYVEVTARSDEEDDKGRRHFRVRFMTVEDGKIVAGEPIGWTLETNLVEGNSPVFTSQDWLNKKGPNAAWKKGEFIGAKVLVGIVGRGAQLQFVALATLKPYLDLVEAAKEENLLISLNSGFRTFAKQASLRKRFENGTGNLAAKPGRSNHQNGIAFDLNTIGFDGTPLYDWLKKNATSHGFIRTVHKEHWHWEYRPEKAEDLRKKGRFKLSRVRK